jgi:hypothetical protein
MGYTSNSGVLFVFSGASGVYQFDQNPEAMDVLAPKQYYSVLPILEGEDKYMRGLKDNEIRKMSWSKTKYENYLALKQFDQRTSSGTIPRTYFWDGIVNEFQGNAVEVINVYGTQIAGNYDYWKVELQFKPITEFDNKKVIL